MMRFSVELRHFSSLKNVSISRPAFYLTPFPGSSWLFSWKYLFPHSIYLVLCICFDQTLTSICTLSVFAANEEYYQLLMINDSQPSGLDVSSYTIEEIDSITSEYTLKNNVSNWIVFEIILIFNFYHWIYRWMLWWFSKCTLPLKQLILFDQWMFWTTKL